MFGKFHNPKTEMIRLWIQGWSSTQCYNSRVLKSESITANRRLEVDVHLDRSTWTASLSVAVVVLLFIHLFFCCGFCSVENLLFLCVCLCVFVNRKSSEETEETLHKTCKRHPAVWKQRSGGTRKWWRQRKAVETTQRNAPLCDVFFFSCGNEKGPKAKRRESENEADVIKPKTAGNWKLGFQNKARV